MHTSDIMHKYEFGERNKDKNNKYSLFARARMNRQLHDAECKHCASRVASSNQASANLANLARPKFTRRTDSLQDKGYCLFAKLHNSNIRMNISDAYENRIFKMFIFIFFTLLHACFYAFQNIYNPKSFGNADVESPGQLSQLVIHGNDAIPVPGIEYKRRSRGLQNHSRSNFPSDKF